jgi:uncharacterized phiE125 gp8 family phage protein
MIIQRTPVSSATPFNLPEVAEHGRLTYPGDQAEVHRLSLAAAREFEDFAQIALLDQTVSVTLEEPIRSAMLALPIAPLVDPLSVDITVDGLAFDAFAVITGLRPAIRFTGDKPCGLVVISYLAGFGATAAAIPDDVKHAVADQAIAYYEIRGPGDGKSNGMSPHMARIAARYRRVAL